MERCARGRRIEVCTDARGSCRTRRVAKAAIRPSFYHRWRVGMRKGGKHPINHIRDVETRQNTEKGWNRSLVVFQFSLCTTIAEAELSVAHTDVG